MRKTKILATGSAMPEKIVTNVDISKMVDTSDEWIVERTGIKARRVVDPKKGETNTEIAKRAAEIALKRAGLTAKDIDIIMYGTVSPDHLVPNSSSELQAKLGAEQAACVDISAACSSFMYALSLADPLIQAGRYERILLIGAEVLSTITDWSDRNTCILFGDGAGALVLGPAAPGETSEILSSHLYADGRERDLFFMPAGGSAMPTTQETLDKRFHFMQMQGREIFKHAVRMLTGAAETALTKNNLTVNDLDWFIPHQANLRIIEAVQKRLNVPSEKIITTVDRYGNTSSASVPVAFDEAITSGKIKRGDLVLMDVFGAGLTWGSALLRY